MTAYINLDTTPIVVDLELARRIPPGLLSYYQALPLACEGDRASVAMAYPTNRTALRVLESLLGARVVPVRGSARAIEAALRQLPKTAEATAAQLIAWSAVPERTAAVRAWADAFAAGRGLPLTLLEGSQLDLDAALTVAREGAFALAVVGLPPGGQCGVLLSGAATSLLLVRSASVGMPQHILVALRGFSADGVALAQLGPLVARTGTAVTLLPLAQSSAATTHELMGADELGRHHLETCIRHLGAAPDRTFVRFRQGSSVEQVVTEIAEGDYDLLVMAAEGYGDFVAGVLSEIEGRGLFAERPFLIIKPRIPPRLPREETQPCE